MDIQLNIKMNFSTKKVELFKLSAHSERVALCDLGSPMTVCVED